MYEDVQNLMVTYRSWNRGGTYGKTPYAFNLSSALGGRSGFKKLTQTVKDLEGVELSLENSPLVLANTNVFDSQLRKNNT